MKSLIIIPTYNERENIALISEAVLNLLSDVHVLVVDDSSPDGTGEIVREMSNTSDRIHLLSRDKKEGLGRAYVAGFKWGLERGYDVLVEMDADFSHRPEDLAKILKQLAQPEVDFVVGSRWVPGGRTVNWGLGRRFISRGGSFYARTILSYPLRDWTGGFNAWTRQVLEGIDLDSVRSEGYSFQIELKYRALSCGFHGHEEPIVFEDRRVGQSKMSSKIMIEALYRVWKIRFEGACAPA